MFCLQGLSSLSTAFAILQRWKNKKGSSNLIPVGAFLFYANTECKPIRGCSKENIKKLRRRERNNGWMLQELFHTVQIESFIITKNVFTLLTACLPEAWLSQLPASNFNLKDTFGQITSTWSSCLERFTQGQA